MKNQKIVIAGGTGFIGQAMAERWSGDNEVIVLARKRKGSIDNSYGNALLQHSNIHYVEWDGESMGDWISAIDGADILINLAGKSVNCRYNAANKAEITNSRILSTRVLGKAILACKKPPVCWINSSSATIYPYATDVPRDEIFTAFADDFSVQVCKAWESEFNSIQLNNTRKVILRTAIVLGKGGVLVPYANLVKYGLGGRQGSGKQLFSWIHMDDLCAVVEWLWEHENESGVFNAASPGAVTNEIFMKSLRRILRMPFGLPAPAWVLKAGAALIDTEAELLLKSRWVIPSRLLKSGFSFRYTAIEAALQNLL